MNLHRIHFLCALCCLFSAALMFPNLAASADLQYVPSDTPVAEEIRLPKPIKHVRQATPGTCWLACAAMVHAYYGEPISEETLDAAVRQITRSDRGGQWEATKRECIIALAKQPGAKEQLLERLASITKDGAKIEVNPLGFAWSKLKSHSERKNLQGLVDALKNGEPVVIVNKQGPLSNREHATIVTAVKLGKTGKPGKLGVIAIEGLDPADDEGATKPISSEFLKQNLQMILTRSFARKWLEEESKNVKVDKADKERTRPRPSSRERNEKREKNDTKPKTIRIL